MKKRARRKRFAPIDLNEDAQFHLGMPLRGDPRIKCSEEMQVLLWHKVRTPLRVNITSQILNQFYRPLEHFFDQIQDDDELELKIEVQKEPETIDDEPKKKGFFDNFFKDLGFFSIALIFVLNGCGKKPVDPYPNGTKVVITEPSAFDCKGEIIAYDGRNLLVDASYLVSLHNCQTKFNSAPKDFLAWIQVRYVEKI